MFEKCKIFHIHFKTSENSKCKYDEQHRNKRFPSSCQDWQSILSCEWFIRGILKNQSKGFSMSIMKHWFSIKNKHLLIGLHMFYVRSTVQSTQLLFLELLSEYRQFKSHWLRFEKNCRYGWLSFEFLGHLRSLRKLVNESYGPDARGCTDHNHYLFSKTIHFWEFKVKVLNPTSLAEVGSSYLMFYSEVN